MNLKKYDNKYVKIIDNQDDVFEGLCTYNNKDYLEVEFGIPKEGLQILNVMFFKDNIKSIVINKDKYTTPYSKIEEFIIEDGIEEFKDLLYDEEYEHIYRTLKYIEDNINNIDYIDDIKKELKEFIKTSDREELIEEANKIIM